MEQRPLKKIAAADPAFRAAHSAVLLLGPTGAGKSPLGDYLDVYGLAGRRCAHLDFGAALRAIADGSPMAGLTDADVAVVRDSLRTGALLENETFHIAAAIVEAFIRSRSLGPRDRVVLNGLPRHVDQARDVDGILDIGRVIFLACTPEVVRARIRSNAGGDRAGREDDDAALIRRKLEVFEARTRPILDHYRGKGVRVEAVRVTETTGPGDIVAGLE